jgi:hypothetical protein
MFRGIFPGRALRHITDDHADLGLEVAAPGDILERDRLTCAKHHARRALIDERIRVERLWGLGVARLAYEHDVVDVRAAIDPLVRAR